mgnify:CR=1 FL=1
MVQMDNLETKELQGLPDEMGYLDQEASLEPQVNLGKLVEMEMMDNQDFPEQQECLGSQVKMVCTALFFFLVCLMFQLSLCKFNYHVINILSPPYKILNHWFANNQ